MYTQTLLATAFLAATTVVADQAENVVRSQVQKQNLSSYLTANQVSKLGSDVKSLALQNTAALNALSSWSATQTAVSDSDIEAQNDEYFNAFVTATATALPAYITALPSSLQSYASSLLVGEASLVVTEVAPVISSVMASASASGYVANSANSTSALIAVATAATSGMPNNSANATVAIASTTSGSPTTPPAPPKAQSSSGAEKNGSFMAAAVVAMGLAGIMSLL